MTVVPALAAAGRPCAAPAAVPEGDAAFLEGSCVEGLTILDGGSCTPQCATGFAASELALQCSDGDLRPANFSCQPCGNELKGWAWYRFVPVKLRGPGNGGVQLGELVFRRLGVGVSLKEALAFTVHGNSSEGFGPERAADGTTQTHWSDSGMPPLVIRFQCPTAIDHYSFCTAGDAPDRDPVRWRLDGSNNRGMSWASLHEVRVDYPTPHDRYQVLGSWFRLPPCLYTTAANNAQVCRSTAELVRRGLTFPEMPP